MRSSSLFLSQSLVTVGSPSCSHLVRLIPRTHVAQAQREAWNIVSCPKVFTSPRAMSYVTSLMSATLSPGIRTPSLTVIRPTSTSSFPYDPLPGEIHPCADLRQLESGSLVEHSNLYRFSTSVPSSRTPEFEGMEDLMCKRRRPPIGSVCRHVPETLVAQPRAESRGLTLVGATVPHVRQNRVNCQIGFATALAV